MKPYYEQDGITMRERMIENEQLRDALEWLTNVCCGVGKEGGDPVMGEFEAAVEAAKAALR